MAFIKEIQTPDNNKHQIKNTIIPVVGTQTVPSGETGIGQWTGNIDIPSLYDGLTIAYFLPCAGSGNATLNLTLSDGSTTGPIDCYYSSGRLTTHYSKGMNIIMTYWSAGSISIDGTPTDKDRWIAQGNYADGNNKVDQNNTTTSNWRHIMLGYASWTTAEPATTTVQQVAYKNNNIKISPAYGRLYMKGSTPQMYLVDTAFDLTASNNGVSSEQWRALRFQDKNSNNISLFINSVNTNATSSQIWTYNKSTDGTTDYNAYLALSIYKSGDKIFFTSPDIYWRLQSSEIDRDGTAPSSKITGKNFIKIADKNGENVGLIRIAQNTDGSTEFQLIGCNENTSGTEVNNIIKLITAKDGTCSYYVSDGPAFRTAIGATDTKNTAGSTDTSSKIYLIGATEQSANPQTYSDNQVYVTNGSLYLTKETDAEGAKDNKPALLIGNPTGTHLELDTNEVMAKASATTTGPLYLNNNGGLVYANNKKVVRLTSDPTSGQIMIADGTDGQIKSSGETIATLKTYVDNAIDSLPEPMVFKGTLGAEEDNPTITDLPTASGENEGDTYKVITAGTYASIEAKVGDVFISNGVEWILIPAGDDVEDTWRSIKVNGTEKLGTGISSGGIDFVNGTNTTVSFNASGNKISIDSTDTNTTYSLSRNNKEILLTGSDNTTSSVDAARVVYLTNEDLNAVVLPGFYNAGGGNSCTNTPNPSSASGFGLIVLQTGGGAWYYQFFNYCGQATTYKRVRNGNTGNWTAWAVTDTNTAQATGYANVVKSDDFTWSAGTLPSLTTKSTTIYPVTSSTTTASKIVSKDTTIYPVKSTTTTATKVVTKSTTLYPVKSTTTTASKVVSKDTTIYPVTSTTTTASKVVSKDTTIYPVTSSTTTASKVVGKDTTIYPVKSTTTTATKVTTSSTTFDQITGVGTLPTLIVSGITLELNQGTLPTSSSVTINDVVSNTDVTVPILSSSVAIKQISSISDVTVPILSSSVSIKQISSISDVTVPILSSSITIKEVSSISDVTVPILSSSISITEVSSNSDVTVPILSSSVTIKEISSNTDVTVPILSSSVTILEVSNWSAGTLPSLSWGSVSAVTGVST